MAQLEMPRTPGTSLGDQPGAHQNPVSLMVQPDIKATPGNSLIDQLFPRQNPDSLKTLFLEVASTFYGSM
jgi:hypothetical protein